MTTREKFKRAVIEAIHGLPYEEAVKKECIVDTETKQKDHPWDYSRTNSDYFPITIGRISRLLYKKKFCFYPAGWNELTLASYSGNPYKEEGAIMKAIPNFHGVWKLTKKNKQEAVDDDQDEKIIKKLLSLLK